MSNLWKALRDVSRDAEPTVGFESAAQGSRADGFGLESALADLAAAPPSAPAIDLDDAGEPPAPSPRGPRPQSAVSRPRPAPAAMPAMPAERRDSGTGNGSGSGRAAIPAPPRRVPSGTALQFDPPMPAPPKDSSAPPAPGEVHSRLADVLNARGGTAPIGGLPVASPPPSTPVNLPRALRAFAPGTPDTSHMAVMVGAAQWHPGDDDVMPKDGRRGAKPRLRDRFGL